jgi:HEAT repeat protein
MGGIMSNHGNTRRKCAVAAAAGRGKQKSGTRGRVLWALASAGILALIPVLTQAAHQAKPPANPKVPQTKAAPAAPVSPAAVRQALERSFTLSGTATPGMESQSFGLQSQSWQRWTLDLRAVNATPYRLSFGNDLLLVEASPESANFDGVRLSIGHEAEAGSGLELLEKAQSQRANRRSADYYGLSNSEERRIDGSLFQVRGNSLSWTSGGTAGDAKTGADVRDFGRLAPGGARSFQVKLDEGVWIKPENLTSVRVILPEVTVGAGNVAERFRIVCYFDRPAGEVKTWKAARQEIVRLEPGELIRLVSIPEGNLVTRVLAANWLADVAPQKAGEVLVQVAQTQRQGQLLATALLLVRETKTPGLETHALALLQDGAAPNGIRRLAALYLGALGSESTIAALVAATMDKDQPVALGAIEALGYHGAASVVEPLLSIVRDQKAASDRQKRAAKSLAQTGQPAAYAALMSLAAAGNEPAIDALVEKGPPDCFDFFLEQVRSGKPNQWRDRLLTGMGKSNPEKALPIFLEMLAKEAPPDKKSPTSTTRLVTELIALKAVKAIPELLLAARDGNLRACQVLAGTKDEAFRKPLLDFAMEAKGPALWIAVDGLLDNWTNSGGDVYRKVLAQPEQPEVLKLAARGLEQMKDQQVGSRLAALLGSSSPEIALAAAEAINGLSTTLPVPDLLPAMLATGDSKVADSLAETLIERKWAERSAIPRLAVRLKEGPPEVRYPVIRLLRHLSKDAMGPEYSSEFEKDAAEWVRKWIEWAEAQSSRR